jgi:acyl-CoA thioester hydrolase
MTAMYYDPATIYPKRPLIVNQTDHQENSMDTPPELSQFPLKTYEKLRYNDTDRQGHINNAVFATMLETGRVELIYNDRHSLARESCAFVIANLNLSFLNEINWPGRVDIGTKVESVGRSSMTLEQAIFQNGRCVATAKTVIVQMNESTRRSHPLDQAAIDYLNSLT